MVRALLRCCSVASVVLIGTLCGCCGDCCDGGCSSCSSSSGHAYVEDDGSSVVIPSNPTFTPPPAPNAEIIDLPPAVNTKAR